MPSHLDPHLHIQAVIVYARGVQQAARGPQPGSPSHLVWPLPTLWFFLIMHETPNPTVYVKKLNLSCGPARCPKLVMWPTDKKCCTPLVYAYFHSLFSAASYSQGNSLVYSAISASPHKTISHQKVRQCTWFCRKLCFSCTPAVLAIFTCKTHPVCFHTKLSSA